MCYGTEMTSNAILAWQEKRSVLWYYNAVRPHTSPNGMTPEAFAQHAIKAYNNPQTLTSN
ncbi:hypothetical protein HK16_08465 [Acetobacter senegalensis]|uniref:Transposase n=2 Tax=Acetobacter TaxID=434 RepID=A0A252EJP9_9PROT|nr:hypothetical protein HK16_08465 [Acetobacter senegalensis]